MRARRAEYHPIDGTVGRLAWQPSPTTTFDATAIGLDTDDSSWDAGPGARPLAQHRRVRRHRRPADVPARVHRARRHADGGAGWITLDGVFYQADVWLDGAYLGDPEGYFFPHTLRYHRRCRDSPTSTSWPSR